MVLMGEQTAAQIMAHLNEKEVAALAFEMTQIGQISPETEKEILREFSELMMTDSLLEFIDVDYVRNFLIKTLGPQKAQTILALLEKKLVTRPLDFLRNIDSGALLNFIQNEHPQTIALILSYLEPARAAQILSDLPEGIQADVARRIAVMERVSPDVLAEMERVLKRKIKSNLDNNFSVAGGIPAVVDVLNLADRASEQAIIAALEEEDPELAEEIKKRMFTFGNIGGLSPEHINLVLREVDSATLTAALKGADVLYPDLMEKLQTGISKRAWQNIMDDLEYLGPTPASKVEECRQKIMAVVRRLETDDKITIPRNDDEEMIV